MSILPKQAYLMQLPLLHQVRQVFPDEKIQDIENSTREEILKLLAEKPLPSDASVAVLVGSRGIASISEIVKSTIDSLKSTGVKPFIVPAMGSHGAGDADQQREILHGFGITETAMGVPIRSSMETVIIGHTEEGIPIHMDKIASEADAIVPIARIKVHTDFEGSIESGLCKMLAIGLGKHNGCSRLHQEGFTSFPKLIPKVAEIILSEKNVAFGVAIIENAHENVHTIKAVPGSSFLSDEPGLLALSKSLMPRLQFEEIDVLIVERIGKDITGAGMDPNITGRMSVGLIPGFSGPKIKRIVVLSLSEGAHHNATGIGIADFITKDVFNSIDLAATYTNCIASGNPEAGKIPIMMENEREAILGALQTAARTDLEHPRIVRIKDTLHLTEIEVSDSLLATCIANPDQFEIKRATQV